MKPNITDTRLKELLHYEPETGVFTRLITVHYNARSGATLQTAMKTGHLRVDLDGKRYLLHRLAWLYMTGAWPEKEIDHLDTDPGNNRWSNLRDVTHEINMQNMRKPFKGNTTGFMGVTTHQGRFVAQISVKNTHKHIGRFGTPEEAHAAYIAVKRQLHAGNTL